MRLVAIFLWLLFAFSPITEAASALIHNYEAIYFYYGYLVDLAINGDKRSIGPRCTPDPESHRSVCTVAEFVKSIMSDYDAARMRPSTLGDTTSPGDLDALAEDMLNWHYTNYALGRLVRGNEDRHSVLLRRVTNILNYARHNRPTVLSGNILAQAKLALLSVHAEREKDILQHKIREFRRIFPQAVVRKRTVFLENIVAFEDIDWAATAEATAQYTNENLAALLREMKRWCSNPGGQDREFLNHWRLLGSIRTQSDSLGSLASCMAL
ncbi:hypothetical protein MPDQ_002039 [Monascus purpureus]|uniref:Uncharacterized protein n=1 Tax=Monascus purpureus TaxID=5098 RepID=A0A507R2S8_MONPU|nr:hypothetical protein MPDQ_002039 [Monascus purpureus]BDD56301.1 hypothetical protein MAP00_001773 [Monascus purpureus]